MKNQNITVLYLIISILVLLISANTFKGFGIANKEVQDNGEGIIPAVQWNQTYGGTDDDYVRVVIEVSDGGYLLAGYTESFGAGNRDIWLIKTDSNGLEQWNQTYGGTDNDNAWIVIEVSDGGYLLVGYTESFGAGNRDIWLIKISEHSSDGFFISLSREMIGGFIVILVGGGILVTVIQYQAKPYQRKSNQEINEKTEVSTQKPHTDVIMNIDTLINEFDKLND
ncbi:MAG: hypothetical protein ACXAC7_18350 [Candidatus Hodarchaeales archaeon]|jgi:hypothetical protein